MTIEKYLVLAISLLLISTTTVFADRDGSTQKKCEDNNGDWDGDECDFTKIDNFEDDKAALEDDLCDDEDAETTNIDLCKSDDLTLGQAFAEKYNKENCEEHNGEWIDGEYDFYENQMKKGWEVDEDNFYKEVCEDEKNESDECKKHRLSREDGE